jgi:hypothetical protein
LDKHLAAAIETRSSFPEHQFVVRNIRYPTILKQKRFQVGKIYIKKLNFRSWEELFASAIMLRNFATIT